MTNLNRWAAGVLVLAAAVTVGQAAVPAKQQAPKANAAGNSAEVSRGQHVFNQNCARCHNPPEGFSPGISRTIATHMRVRAGLSDRDYKALLKYLNP